MSYSITKADLGDIIQGAKRNMVSFNLPLEISNKAVDPREVPSLAILESTLSFLTSKKLLTNAVTVDYTDPGSAHDPEPPLEE
jgi:hypothetical protein